MRGWSSPWDGGDRRALAVVLAIVAGWDLIGLAIELLLAPRSGLPHPGAPTWLLALAGSSAAVLVLASIGVLAAMVLARSHRPITSAAIVLACSGVLVEAAAAVGPGPYRARFFVGAMLLGSIAGRVWARIADDAHASRAAEAGAVAMLAATYLGAASSKLGGTGLAWIDATTLRAVALAHTAVDDPGAAGWLADAPALARLLAIATVAVQLGALLHPWWRSTRIVTGVALVGFHLGVATFAGIGYWQPVVLLLAYSLPWPRWIPRLRAPASSSVRAQDPMSTEHGVRATTANRWLAAITLAMVLAAWWLPWRNYTDGHHRPRGLDGGASVARVRVDAFGPIAVGDRLTDGWRIDAIAREPARAMVVLGHDAHARAVLWISARRERAPGSPFDRANVRVGYEGDHADAFAAAARELAERLDRAAGSPAGVDAWLSE